MAGRMGASLQSSFLSEAIRRASAARNIQERFEAFHHAHPEVYRQLVLFARQAKASGRAQYGIGALFERVRWHFYIEQRLGDEAWKLNNNYRSRYARLIMQQEPDLRGFFNLRELRAD